MSEKCRTRSAWPGRRGMTLIEVVAGLALLATVLTLVFAARGHVARQQVRADRRLAAVAAADGLLADWWQRPAEFPRAGSGPVPGHPNLAWHTEVVRNAAVEALGTEVVRLAVSGASPGGGPDQPVVTVEVALPPIVSPAAPAPGSVQVPKVRGGRP
jgi:prepilin-type N-terminal cleavage/methylation domain-containing protein